MEYDGVTILGGGLTISYPLTVVKHYNLRTNLKHQLKSLNYSKDTNKNTSDKNTEHMWTGTCTSQQHIDTKYGSDSTCNF